MNDLRPVMRNASADRRWRIASGGSVAEDRFPSESLRVSCLAFFGGENYSLKQHDSPIKSDLHEMPKCSELKKKMRIKCTYTSFYRL